MSEPMTHDEVQNLLEDYVDERLDRTTRRAVDEHLYSCERCASLLDDVPAIDLGVFAETVWDERAMRTAVRRSMIRTAFNVVLLLVAGALVLLLVSSLVLQPLLVGRGGRAAAATRLTADLAIMFNPGATVDDWRFESGILSRTTSVRVVTPVGTELTDLGTVDSRLTVTGFGDADGGLFSPPAITETGGDGQLLQRLAQLGEGTVATVELVWLETIGLAEAEALTATPHDVRVVWLGFAVDDAGEYTGPGFDSGGVLGGATCDRPPIPEDVSSSGSGGGSGSVFALPSSPSRALDQVQGALAEMLDHPEIAESLAHGWSLVSVERAAAFVSEGRVRTMVVTGPTTELQAFVRDVGPDFGGIRDVDFYNWFSPICGR